MQYPLVSIITVVLNASKTIEDTIKSVLNQSYKNLEYIIVDGGSTDGTMAIINKYKQCNLIFESGPDKGIYDAMNKGIAMAQGDWIYFLGADDTLYNNDVLEKVFCNDANLFVDFLYGNVYSVGMRGSYGGEFDLQRLLFRNMSHQAIFYKRNIYNKIGLYNLRYKLFADWDFNIRCYLNDIIKRKYINVTIAKFSDGGASSTKEDLLFLQEVAFTQNIKYLQARGIKWLYKINIYDKWWRLIRNMELNNASQLEEVEERTSLPFEIRKIINLQAKIRRKWLMNGILSKGLMVLNYCGSYVQRLLGKR